MSEPIAKPRRVRFNLRGLMLFIVMFALATTVVIQTLRLQQAAIRVEQLQAERDMERARAEQARLVAELEESRLQEHMTTEADPGH